MNCFRFPHRIVLWTLVGILAGCEKEETVRSYAAPKEPKTVSWTVPDGWRGLPFKQSDPQIKGMFQYGLFAAGDEAAAVQISVTTLFPDEPGTTDLLLNVNRWRGQLGLPAVDAAALGRLVQAESTPGATMQWVDTTGLERRMRAVIVPREDRVWFFKMSGGAEEVESHKEQFNAFVKSARFLTPAAEPLRVVAEATPGAAGPVDPHPQMPTPAPSKNSAAQEAGGLMFKLPAGWSQQPSANAMRKLTLKTAGVPPAELIVTQLASNFGGMAMNVTRWRGEVGLSPADDAAAVPQTPVRIGFGQGALMDFIGPGKGDSQPMRSLVAMYTQGNSVWFFKILGSAQTVTQQRAAFEEFLASVTLPPEGK